MLFGKAYAILYNPVGRPLPYLMAVEAENEKWWHHGFGPSYMGKPDPLVILAEYDLNTASRDEVEEAFDALEIQWYHDNPLKPETRGTNGWIAPDGKMYPCSYAEHQTFARQLTLQFYRSPRGSLMLEEKGWVHLSAGYPTAWSHYPTKQQLDTLMDLTTMLGSYEAEDIKSFLERHLDNALS